MISERTRGLARAMLFATAALQLGCFTTYTVSPGELTKLQGLREGSRVDLVAYWSSDSDRNLKFDEHAALFIRDLPDRPSGVHFRTIDVADGRVVEGTTVDGERVVVDVSQARIVHVRKFSASKTVALCFGVTAATAVFFGLFVAAFASSYRVL